jgi:hypothetical protein
MCKTDLLTVPVRNAEDLAFGDGAGPGIPWHMFALLDFVHSNIVSSPDGD